MEEIKNTWVNPFSVDRVEDWRVEERPENYIKIATLFSPPDFMNKLEDPAITKAIFIIGGRGCGKSHILRRMAIQSEIEALEAKSNRKLRVADFEKKYFGVYIKTDCFSPLSKEGITYLKKEQLEVLFEHLFNIEVAKAIIEGIQFLPTYFEDSSFVNETIICKKIETYLKWNCGSINHFSDLLECLNNQAKQITELVKNFPFDDDFKKYSSKLHFTQTPNFIIEIYSTICNEIGLLKNKSLILLLDEYESLDENQQRVINQIIKGRRLTLRIAVKVRGIKTLHTKTNERLDEIHDYVPIDLHFKLDRENRPRYKHLLKEIFENRLGQEDEHGGYKEKAPEKLLPAPTFKDEGLTNEEIENELLDLKDSLKKSKEIKNPDNYWKNFKGHYKEAAIFRVLKNKGKDKLYAGFNEYVSLSSGIIRLFIWLCRETFTVAYQEKVDVLNGVPINVYLQNKAALNVAKNELDITIPQTINNIYASRLACFIHDIGQILRARLYYSTQPQANRIEIIDPEKFELAGYEIPRELIESGQDLPVFLAESSFKPRDVKYPFPKTFALNGIFAPLLKIPPEERWRTELRAEEIKGLCLTESRSEVLESIVSQIKGKNRVVRKNTKDSKEKGVKTLDLFRNTPEPITLENCPVTGRGCNRDLQNYEMSTQSMMHAFLAIPFDKGWVSDPRGWIKDAFLEFNMVCKDTDDFPNLSYILCKICSCVRQYPFGMFEITELNPNVIFELGMATGLNKFNYLFVFKDKIPTQYKADFPPAPLSGIKYIPYELSSGAILRKVQEEIMPVVNVLAKGNNKKCKIIDSKCPHQISSTGKMKIFVGLPDNNNNNFFDEVYNVIKKITKSPTYVLNRHHPAKSLNELCQICNNVRESSFCIIDTTYNNISMLFALGVAFGRDKKIVQLHDTELDHNRPISDLRPWAIEYRNLSELKKLLKAELPKRLGII